MYINKKIGTIVLIGDEFVRIVCIVRMYVYEFVRIVRIVRIRMYGYEFVRIVCIVNCLYS